ncbi:hypothetical protein [Streptomyces sp. NPDC005930]|uniref:hypothetical protein n=1 Tax=Streptomyces sp. NPDC005930 TaxID=3364736 RepID=UPI00369AFC77
MFSEQRVAELLLGRAGRPAGPKNRPNPVARTRPGSKHHLIVEMSLTDGTAGATS